MNKENLLLEQWRVASELHRHENNLSWQKFNYFIATNGVLISVLGAGWSMAARYNVNIRPLGLVILFGAIVSFVWTAIQRHGQLYQRYRIEQAKKAEKDLKINNERILTLYEKGFNEQDLVKKPKFFGKIPTQSLMVTLGILLTIGWLILLGWFLID